jgi:hypothetical protein
MIQEVHKIIMMDFHLELHNLPLHNSMKIIDNLVYL